jgi:hypothetical protein
MLDAPLARPLTSVNPITSVLTTALTTTALITSTSTPAASLRPLPRMPHA